MDHSSHKAPPRKPQYMRATGRLPHPLTNDYMFKALLQKNPTALRHLIGSLLHLQPKEIESVEIKNPIVLGETLTKDFDSKIFVLDINVLLNDQTLINLEMQVIDYKNWPERAMTYLCRNFDQLSRGTDYIKARPTIHIGFLDFTLFPECPEFYATYKMMNVKRRHIFTDKFTLSVVDLKHIELATPEDRAWEIDCWASLFKATTWEELKMLAKQSPILQDTVETIYELTADESIREQCKAREKQIREMNTIVSEREMAIHARDKAVQEKDKAVREKDKAVQEKDKAVQEKDKAVQEKDKAVQEKDKAVQEKDKAVQEKDKAVQEKDIAVQERDEMNRQFAQQVKQIEELLQENKRLKAQQTHNA